MKFVTERFASFAVYGGVFGLVFALVFIAVEPKQRPATLSEMFNVLALPLRWSLNFLFQHGFLRGEPMFLMIVVQVFYFMCLGALLGSLVGIITRHWRYNR